MKPLILSALLAGLLMTASCGSDSSASANVVARVNGKDITTTELEKQVRVQLNGAEQPASVEEQEDLKLQVLNQLINNQILLEMASAQNLNATDAEVDVKFNELKSQGTEEQFKEMLQKQKMTVDDVRSELRKSIAIDKLVKNGGAGEDEGRRAEGELDKLTQTYVAQVDELLKHKEAELLEV